MNSFVNVNIYNKSLNMNIPVKKIEEILSSPQNIILVTHINPDGDAVGSSVAMARYLTLKGHSVVAITPNEVPPYLKKMVGVEILHDYSREFEVLDRAIEEASVIICVDFNEIATRIGIMAEKIYENKSAVRVVIDHHLSPVESDYNVVVSDQTSPSTTFIIAKLIEAMGDRDIIDKIIAENLYLGMVTDTGNFSYGNLSSDFFCVVAMIVEKGVNPVEINNKVFNTHSLTRMRLVGYCLFKKMHIIKHRRMAYITLSETELMNFNHKSGDTEGIVNMPLSIEGIELSALFIENKECIKISLRSQGANAVDVNRLAREHFSGGGHRMAAGAKSFATMEETVDKFVKAVDMIYQ